MLDGKWNRVLKCVDRDEVVRLAKELIEIPSENPPGREKKVAQYIDQKLREIGIEPKRYEFEPGRTNIMGALKGSGQGRRLMLNAHTDTVPVGDKTLWKRNPFGEVRDGRIYGRGACDMKGAIAAMIETAYVLKRSEVEFNGEFVVTAFADEEDMGLKGAKALAERGLLKADAAIGCEPSGLAINTCERGTVWLEIETRGKSVHTSKARDGINSNVKMSRIILAAEKLKFRVRKHKLLGTPTLASATTIHGGTRINVVPDSCKATFDVRIPPGLAPEEVVSEFRKMIKRLESEDPRLHAKLKVIHLDGAVETSEDEEIVRVAKNVLREYFGTEPRIEGMPGGTDMKVFVKGMKIPSIIALGPGKIDTAHTADEYVEIDELVDASKIYATIALEYLGEVH